MELDINKATQPYEYYLKFIQQNCRPDNRKLSDIRACKLQVDCINTVRGSSLAKLGSTSVVCGITARVCRPKEERPDQGFVICNVELPALCSSKNFRTSSTSQQATASLSTSASVEQSQAMLSQLMQDVLAESKCVRETDLCIREGKLAWVLYIDMICLNNDGNVQDACCLAMISALKTLRLYEMDYDENEERATLKQPLSTVEMKLYAEPVCTTLFALEDAILMSDPNKQEEDFMRSFIVVCTTDENTFCMLRKYGGMSLTSEQLTLCIERALRNGVHVRRHILQASRGNDSTADDTVLAME